MHYNQTVPTIIYLKVRADAGSIVIFFYPELGTTFVC